jgi:DNA (cytosine-5)-methyltransferase 1
MSASGIEGLTVQGVVLSLFPGADLLGRGFRDEGWCIVSGPEKILGGDIRDFHGRRGVFAGVIGGPPCQDFSRARRCAATGYGLEMIGEFLRVVEECEPAWWLIENVPTVPTVTLRGWMVQRFDLRADECGVAQARLRHFQFGHRREWERLVIHRGTRIAAASHTVTATEGRRSVTRRRTFAHVCSLQGAAPFRSEWLTRAGHYGVIGNGVPVPMARVIARAIIERSSVTGQVRRSCACGCGRELTGAATLATCACRKRMQRRRDSAGVKRPGPVTIAESQGGLAL